MITLDRGFTGRRIRGGALVARWREDAVVRGEHGRATRGGAPGRGRRDLRQHRRPRSGGADGVCGVGHSTEPCVRRRPARPESCPAPLSNCCSTGPQKRAGPPRPAQLGSTTCTLLTRSGSSAASAARSTWSNSTARVAAGISRCSRRSLDLPVSRRPRGDTAPPSDSALPGIGCARTVIGTRGRRWSDSCVLCGLVRWLSASRSTTTDMR